MVHSLNPALLAGRAQISALRENQCCVLLDYDEARPPLPVAQIGYWQGVYYVAGPLAFELFPFFNLYDTLHLIHGQGPPAMVDFYNGILAHGGGPQEAHIFTCSSVEDVLRTLDALLEAYALTL